MTRTNLVSEVNLKVVFAYAVRHEQQQNIFTDRTVIVKVPVGVVHIFKFLKKDNVWQSAPLSMCGLSHSDIGGSYEEKEKRPDGCAVCPICEQIWKNDPHSPWRTFVNGEGIKVS